MNPLRRILRRRRPETARRQILHFLYNHHDQSWNTTQLAQLVNLPDTQVALILADLAEHGWVIPIHRDRVSLTGHGFFAADNELYGATK